jgi:hypothetical protein
LLCASLAACSPFAVFDGGSRISCPEPRRIERPEGLAELVRYAEVLRVLDADALQREYQQVEERFSDRQAVMDRFSLILLLSMPETPFRNDVRARELLSEYVERNRDDGAYWHMAQFLLRDLNERRAMEQAMEAERRQTLQLRKQVQELKAIEQHMDQRDQVKEQRGSP